MILVYESDGEKVKVGDATVSYGKAATVVSWEAPMGNNKFTIPGTVYTQDENGGETNGHFAINLGMKWVRE